MRSLINHIRNMRKYTFLLKQLINRDFKVKYKRSFLGILWSLLNPLLMMIVMNTVFSELFKVQIENYFLYIITGLVVFNYFSDATNQAMMSIVGNIVLINKIYVPKYIFPLSKVFSSFINFMMSMGALYLIVLLTGHNVTITHLMLVFLVFYLTLFSLGVGYLLSSLLVFFRDVQFLYSIIILIWMYLTPIMYPMDIIPEKYIRIVELNPLLNYVSYIRTVVIDNQMPSISLQIACLLTSLFSIGIGLTFFKTTQDKFADYM